MKRFFIKSFITIIVINIIIIIIIIIISMVELSRDGLDYAEMGWFMEKWVGLSNFGWILTTADVGWITLTLYKQ